jgi:hypothetical protein
MWISHENFNDQPTYQPFPPMSHRSLLLRANRVLGASLVEHNLVNIEHLEAANERLFEVLKGGVTPQASLLSILQDEMGSLNESELMDFEIREFGLGLVDLRNYLIPDECRSLVEAELTWATWTLPFDREEDFYFVATSYYLSLAAREFWEEKLARPIIWYVTPMASMVEVVARLEEEARQAVR